MSNTTKMEFRELQFEFQRIDDEFDQLDELCELLDFKDTHLSEELSEEHQTFDNALSEYDYWR